MKLSVELQQPTLPCEAVTGLIGREPYREPIFCQRPATLVCDYCGDAVCIRCTDPCFECGENLHDQCRDDHAKETKHSIDIPVYVAQLDEFIEVILSTGKRFQ